MKRLLLAIILCLPLSNASAEHNADVYNVGQSLGDGKNGAIFRKWSQQLGSRKVQRVYVTLRKTKGGNDVYINARFGDGNTLENGKRVYLKDQTSKTVNWNVGGQSPNGLPLILNVYNGEIFVDTVRVAYAGGRHGGFPQLTPPSRTPRPRDRDDYRYRDDDRRDNHRDDRRNDRTGTRSIEEECRYARVRRPRIEVGRVKPSGGFLSGKYRVSGSIFGACVVEAGYFENGRLEKKINFPLSLSHSRQDFEVRVRSGRNGKIQVLTVDGHDEVLYIDEEILKRDKNFNTPGIPRTQ